VAQQLHNITIIAGHEFGACLWTFSSYP